MTKYYYINLTLHLFHYHPANIGIAAKSFVLGCSHVRRTLYLLFYLILHVFESFFNVRINISFVLLSIYLSLLSFSNVSRKIEEPTKCNYFPLYLIIHSSKLNIYIKLMLLWFVDCFVEQIRFICHVRHNAKGLRWISLTN